MKIKLLAIAAIATTSCTVIHGDKRQGTYTYASVGGNASKLTQTADGVAAEGIDNVSAAKEVVDLAKTYTWAKAIESISNTTTKATANVTKKSIDADTTKALSNDATKVRLKEIEATPVEAAPAP